MCGVWYKMCGCGYLRLGVWMESGVRACVKYILIQQSKLFMPLALKFVPLAVQYFSFPVNFILSLY